MKTDTACQLAGKEALSDGDDVNKLTDGQYYDMVSEPVDIYSKNGCLHSGRLRQGLSCSSLAWET